MPPNGPAFVDWRPLLPGAALWALALYLPLSAPLERLEEALAGGSLGPIGRELLLVVSNLLLALAVGGLTDLALGWALGPGWAASLGLIAVLGGSLLALGGR
jgi:hypothetical protein